MIVISDEAHRTQYGRLALNMRMALPNAQFIGFTGTPLIDANEKSATEQVFGSYVSIYDFQRAVSAPGMALGFKPRLLGRDYLHLVWQSNMMDERGFWRLMYTRNLSDGGQEIAAYGEAVLNGRISAYLLAVLPQGDARQEFSALTRRSLTLGLKIALP